VSCAAGCGCGCLITRLSRRHAAGWWCAARPCGARGSCRWPQAPGRCGGCERAGKAHQATQVWGRGAVGRGCADRAPWVGAGLTYGCRRSPERVWTLLALPLESLPAALTVKGAGGEKQPGRTPTLVLSVSGWLLFRKAARALCGLLIHEPPRSSWATRPPPQPMPASEGDGWRDIKNHLDYA